MIKPEEIKEYLGTMSDAKVAVMFGITRERVRQYRVKFGVPKYKSPRNRDWTEEELSWLGKLTDEEVADLIGIPKSVVRAKRYELGIRLHINWTDKMLAELGTMSDRKFAKKYDISLGSVIRKRTELGIPACESVQNRWKPLVNWTPELDSILGTVPDSAIAEQLSVGVHVVYARRQKLGIPACYQKRTNQ